MIEFLIFSDIHMASYAACSTIQDGVNSRLLACSSALNQVRSYAQEHSISTTFFLGDLFQSTSRLDVEVLNAVYEGLKGWPSTLYCLVGNHDLAQPSRGIHALEVFKDHVEVIDQPTFLDLGGKRFFLAPYRREGWKEEIRKHKAHYYLLHQGIEGVAVRPGLYLREKMILEDLPARGKIFSGHYHRFERPLPNVYYVGSLLHRDWSDVGSKKGFLHVRNGKVIRRVFTQAPEFVQLSVSQIEDLEEQASKISGNYVRLDTTGAVGGPGVSFLERAYALGALWVGIEAAKSVWRKEEPEQGVISITRLLRDRVREAHVSLKKKPLFDLGVKLLDWGSKSTVGHSGESQGVF